MQIITKAHHIQQLSIQLRQQNKKLGFVPTMGNLHLGHVALIKAIKKKCDIVVVSIFINPLQFAPNEDLENYPRTITKDIQLLEQQQVDVLFNPSVDDIYQDGRNRTVLDIPSMTRLHCGKLRFNHFQGVLTVVNLLFNLVQPHYAAFGKKDYQQLRVIKRMVLDLHLNIKLIAVDIGRDKNGLALSSRNNYLQPAEKKIAHNIYLVLKKCEQAILQGEVHNYQYLADQARRSLSELGFVPEYVNISRQDNLMPAQAGDKKLVILLAAKLGTTRLIDNIEINLKS